MSRPSRSAIPGEYWHIMLRGIGHMDLFLDDDDYCRFRDILNKYCKELNLPIHAYCMMSNHVHILLKADNAELPILFKKVEVSYAYYFNSRYEHVGHLFQNRYKSEAITDDAYLLTALRYILRNPETAEICPWRDYPWSSASAYLSRPDDCTDTSLIIEMLGGSEHVDEFVSSAIDKELSEPMVNLKRLSDSEVRGILTRLLNSNHPMDIQAKDKTKQARVLTAAKKAGASVRQLERLTGINRNIVQRAK